jgi:hypothetical protein
MLEEGYNGNNMKRDCQERKADNTICIICVRIHFTIKEAMTGVILSSPTQGRFFLDRTLILFFNK